VFAQCRRYYTIFGDRSVLLEVHVVNATESDDAVSTR
jgi:hypothetical protein